MCWNNCKVASAAAMEGLLAARVKKHGWRKMVKMRIIGSQQTWNPQGASRKECVPFPPPPAFSLEPPVSKTKRELVA